MTIGERLRLQREQVNLTQEDLADKLDITRQTISKWELDKSLPSLNELIHLAKIYELSLDELVLGKEVSQNPAYKSWLQAEWAQLRSQLEPILVEDVIRKKAEISLTSLGKESVFQTSLGKRLKKGLLNSTTFLIEGSYYPPNPLIGNRGEQCLLEVTSEELIISEIKAGSVLKLNWTKHLTEIQRLCYEEIEYVGIGVQKRSEFVFGMPSDVKGLFNLLLEVSLKDGRFYVFASSSISQVKQLFKLLDLANVTINDPLGLAEIYQNPQISDPLNYLKDNFSIIVPKALSEKYIVTL